MPQNLPIALTPFVGRGELQEEIGARLVDPDYRLLTLLGPGGSGKTRLALESARQLVEGPGQTCFPDGIFFVPLASIGNAAGIVPAIAQSVGLSFYGEGEPQAQLLGYLKLKKLLLILDNYEHLVGDVGLVVEILRAAPGVKVLVTSRVKLNLPAELLIPVPGMDYPSTTSELAPQPQYGAVKLFLQCVRRVKPDFVLDADNNAAMIRICQLVQGMPLGILLATAWLNMLTPLEIADEIARSLDFLDVDWQEVPTRQKSMRGVFDHSWQLLNAREKAILCGFSVFVGGCTREAAYAVTAASLRDLLGLINKSQLSRTSNGRYEMHELLRQYTAERLAQQPADERNARERHSVYYAERLKRWEMALKSSQQHQAIVEITDELENIRITVNWLLEHSEFTFLEHALNAIGIYFELLNRYQEGAALFQMVAEKANVFTSADGVRVRARAFGWQAFMTQQTGNFNLASDIIKESLSILGLLEVVNDAPEELEIPASVSDKGLTAFVFWSAGMAFFQNQYEKTVWLFQKSLALYRLIDDKWSTARLLYFIGSATRTSEGLNWKVAPLYRESLEIAEALGDNRRILQNYAKLSTCLIAKGSIEEGEKYLKSIQNLVEKTGAIRTVFDMFQEHYAHLLLGKFYQESINLEREIKRFENENVRLRILEGHYFLCRCYLHMGRYEESHTLINDCIDRCVSNKYKGMVLLLYPELVRILIARNDYAEAQKLSDQNDHMYQEAGVYYNFDVMHGLIALGTGQLQQAQSNFRRSLEVRIQQRAGHALFQALPGTALLLSNLGQYQRAVELYALASQLPYVANSAWFEDVAGKHIAKAAESLPSEVVEAAKVRGRALDLWATAEELLAELGAEEQIV